MLRVDNRTVREAQIGKLARLRAERDQAACDAALAGLSEAAAGDGNLLAAAVDAARARATVGEISDAMEKAFGRHQAEVRAVTGIYGSEASGMADRIATFDETVRRMSSSQGRSRVGARLDATLRLRRRRLELGTGGA